MGKWFNENYRHRVPIALDFSAIDAGAVDVEIIIPSDWNLFWSTIRSDMLDVVLTGAKGDVLSFNFKAGFNYANKTLTLQIDGLNCITANTIQLCFLYFAFSSEATDRKVAVTINTPKEGFVELGAPFARVVTATNARNVTDQPQIAFAKSTGEKINVFFQLQNLLAPRIDQFNKRMNFEEIESVKVAAYNKEGAAVTTVYKTTATRFISGFVQVRLEAGSNNTNYAIALLINTTQGQLYDVRCLLKVKDQLPT